MNRVIGVDESTRGGRYILAGAVYQETALRDITELIRRHRLPGQRRWHSKTESDGRRRRFLRDCVESGLFRAWIYSISSANIRRGRERIMSELVMDLAKDGVGRLVIERADAAQDARDRRAIHRALRSVSVDLTYTHESPWADPGIQLADGIAWAYGANGVWRKQILPIVDIIRDLHN